MLAAVAGLPRVLLPILLSGCRTILSAPLHFIVHFTLARTLPLLPNKMQQDTENQAAVILDFLCNPRYKFRLMRYLYRCRLWGPDGCKER